MNHSDSERIAALEAKVAALQATIVALSEWQKAQARLLEYVNLEVEERHEAYDHFASATTDAVEAMPSLWQALEARIAAIEKRHRRLDDGLREMMAKGTPDT